LSLCSPSARCCSMPIFLSSLIRLHPISTLFPYTTLFRSRELILQALTHELWRGVALRVLALRRGQVQGRDRVSHRHLGLAIQGDAVDGGGEQVIRLVLIRAEDGLASLQGDPLLIARLLRGGEPLGLDFDVVPDEARDFLVVPLALRAVLLIS